MTIDRPLWPIPRPGWLTGLREPFDNRRVRIAAERPLPRCCPVQPAAWLALLTLLLATPAVAKSASPDIPPDAVLASVPMLPSKEANRVIVNLAPRDERPFPLMLDTGATSSILTPRYARALGVIVRRAQLRTYEHSTLLGRNLQFWVDTWVSGTASRTGWEAGFLGGEFVSRYVLELDFGARRVRFLDPRRFAVPRSVSAPDQAVLALRVVENRPFVDVRVDGKPLHVLLDTGDPSPMFLTGAAARHAGISHPELAELGYYGYLERLPAYLIQADRLEIGPFHFAPAPMVFGPNGNFNSAGSSGSHLGIAALEQFDVRIDYPHRRLWLKREKSGPLTWLSSFEKIRARRAGVGLAFGKAGAEVSAVLPNSPAAQIGLRAGDQVAWSPDDSHAQQIASLLERIEKGEPITVSRTGNGAPVKTVLGAKQPTPHNP